MLFSYLFWLFAVILCFASPIHSLEDCICCGQQIVRFPLIKFGQECYPGEWPWHTAISHLDSISSTYKYRCGGTLIHSQYVLTVAHCAKLPSRRLVPRNILAAVGRYDMALAHEKNGQHRFVRKVIAHEDFNQDSLENDIALLQLETSVTYTQYVQPICLWNQNLPAFSGDWGTIVGWGLTEQNSPDLSTLKKIKIPIIDPMQCLMKARVDFGNLIYNKMFCAGSKDGTGACTGDSGGGMYFYHDGQWFLRGIVSFAKSLNNECDLQQYVGFTDAAGFVNWITKNI